MNKNQFTFHRAPLGIVFFSTSSLFPSAPWSPPSSLIEDDVCVCAVPWHCHTAPRILSKQPTSPTRNSLSLDFPTNRQSLSADQKWKKKLFHIFELPSAFHYFNDDLDFSRRKALICVKGLTCGRVFGWKMSAQGSHTQNQVDFLFADE